MSIVKNIDKTVTYLKIHINTLNIAQVVKHLKLKLHKFKAPRVKTFKTLPKEKKSYIITIIQQQKRLLKTWNTSC